MPTACSFGYRPGAVWRLLASLPPSLQAAVRDALAGPGAAAPPLGPGEIAAAAPFTDAGVWSWLHAFESGRHVDDQEVESGKMFEQAEALMQRAMEADTETGYLEVRYDPASQRRTHTYLNDRYAALRGASRPELLARLAARTVDLPAPPPDFLAALLHALLRRRAATCTQYVRAACGGRAVLLWEHSRKRFDGDGRVVKVHAALAVIADGSETSTDLHPSDALAPADGVSRLAPANGAQRLQGGTCIGHRDAPNSFSHSLPRR